jgi:hypothetical protein
MKNSIFKSNYEQIIKNLFLFLVIGVLAFTASCTTDEDPNPDDEDPTEKPTAADQNTIVIGTEKIALTKVGFGAGQVRGTAATNTLKLGIVFMFFSNEDTGNSLNPPAPGNYSLIESATGLVTEKGKVALRISITDDVFSNYISIAEGIVKVSKDTDGYFSYELTNVKLKYSNLLQTAKDGITISANLGGNPYAAIKNTKSAENGTYVLADNIYTLKTTKPITYNSAGEGEVNAFTIESDNRSSMTIFFKSYSGLPNGTYKISSGLNFGSFFVKEGTCQITMRETYITGGNDWGTFYAVPEVGSIKVTTIGAVTSFEFTDVIMAFSTTNEIYFPLSGKFSN